jgi:hypothetical protein
VIVLHPLTFAEDMQFMTTTGPPAEPEIGAFFAEYTFDERIRLHAHPRLTELAQLVALRHSQSFGFSHGQTDTFDKRGLTTAPGADHRVVKRTELDGGPILVRRPAKSSPECQASQM